MTYRPYLLYFAAFKQSAVEGIELTAFTTVEQAVETLIESYDESLPEILTMSLQEFEASAHFGAGLFIRNSWYLWWHEGYGCDSWPKKKPALVKYFNDQGIVYPDHMSSILMVSLYLRVHNLSLR